MQNAATFRRMIFCIGFIAFFGCSSPSLSGAHLITQFDPTALRVRRPSLESLDVESLPPGEGLPKVGTVRNSDGRSGAYDCEKIESLFRGLALGPLRSCFSSLSILSGDMKPYDAHYRLKRETQPVLELQDQEEAPACLRQQLRTLRVPREVIFQKVVTERSFQECYTSRLDTEADRILGVRLPIARVDLVVHFPLRPIPQSDSEMIRLLSAWELSLFKDSESGAFRSTFLPSILCQRCWGETVQHPLGTEAPQKLWP
ncbi:MAG: hypothetical protein H7222_15605 [Methylotenera sp.]|nr:hypothetical protein [Oligoflexia bacterium]